ncbi:MAG TPA: hypothetical protein VNA11_07440 [Pseudonocardia sp.]|nr:hypothetical protein [Pseudonocardia sp.]
MGAHGGSNSGDVDHDPTLPPDPIRFWADRMQLRGPTGLGHPWELPDPDPGYLRAATP